MELKHVQPLTARWLTDNGYTFRREVKMPEYGRADFVAKDQNGNTLIIECKPALDRRTRSYIMQLLSYCHQLSNEVAGGIAVPENEITDFGRTLCLQYDIKLIPIAIPESLNASAPKINFPTLTVDVLSSENLPLPLILANACDFPLAHTLMKNVYYYCVQDWIRGITGEPDARMTVNTVKKYLAISMHVLPYKAKDGKTYQRLYTNDQGLYLITQHLRPKKSRPLLGEFKRYLAQVSVLVDETRRHSGNTMK